VSATIRRATALDLPAITDYCARSLGGTAQAFRRYFDHRWTREPEPGFVIEDEGAIHGFIGTIHAERVVRRERRRFCNLTSIAVDESHRKLSLQLFKTALADKQTTYTSFSPSPTVVEILKFFKFGTHPIEKLVVAPVPARPRGIVPPKIHLSADALCRGLDDAEAAIARDHAGVGRCVVVMIERGTRQCLVVAVRRGRTVRAYSEIVHLSDADLAIETLPWLQAVITMRHGTVITMLEPRLLNVRPPVAHKLTKFRPLMFRSPDLALRDIEGLYTELCL
jgi:hypothetical protein